MPEKGCRPSLRQAGTLSQASHWNQIIDVAGGECNICEVLHANCSAFHFNLNAGLLAFTSPCRRNSPPAWRGPTANLGFGPFFRRLYGRAISCRAFEIRHGSRHYRRRPLRLRSSGVANPHLSLQSSSRPISCRPRRAARRRRFQGSPMSWTVRGSPALPPILPLARK